MRDDRVGRRPSRCAYSLGRRRSGTSSAMSASPSAVAIGLGHAEQLADHGERQRERERGDEVDRGVGPGRGDRVEQVVDDRLRRAAAALRPAAARTPRDTSRRSRVWSGGSTASMCRANAGPGRPSATTPSPLASAACMSLESRGSFSASSRLVVADDEPGVVAVGERDRVHGAVLAHLGEQRERVVAVVAAPRLQCIGCAHRPIIHPAPSLRLPVRKRSSPLARYPRSSASG